MNKNSKRDWEAVSGFDSDGARIKGDLDLLEKGGLGDDEISELLADLVRDGRVSSAAALALPTLMGELPLLSEIERFQCIYAACLIVGLDDAIGVESDSGDKSERIELRSRILKGLLAQASTMDLSDEWLAAVAGALLLVAGKQSAYRELVDDNR